MSKFFIERPIFAIVLSIIITLIGLISVFNLPVAQYPQITPPQTIVSTSYVGANAQVVEDTIAQVVEPQVNGVDNMVSMLSTSTDAGSYQLNVKFELGSSPDIDAVQTQNRLAQANPYLPPLVLASGITIRKVSPDNAMTFALFSPHHSYDSVFLKNYGDINIIEDLKRVKGVGNINEYGADFGMRIWLHPDKMAQLGITVADIINAVSDQNVSAPAGTIGEQPSPGDQVFQYTVRVQGNLKEPQEFQNIIVRADPDGTLIRLKDVAKVDLGGRNYLVSTDINGEPAAGYAIQLTTDANALETVTECKKVISEASKRFPDDMKYSIVVDNTQFISESLKEVEKTFAEALILVLLVVFLFLQSWRATLIPMLAVPVSLIGTFGSFLILGFSINTLTLFAMVLAIGLVVDDAIVVIEAVEHHMRYSGLSPHDATVRAMSEVSGPVVAIAFVLASVFIPVAFLGGTVGVLYKQFALTITISMALSAFVALTLTPALCASILKPINPQTQKGILANFFNHFNDWFESTVDKYGKGLGKIVRRTVLCTVVVGIILIFCISLMNVVPSSFVPAEDQGYYISVVNLPEASSMNRTYDLSRKIADAIRHQPGVDSTMLVTGTDFLTYANKPNAALIMTRLKPWSERKSPKLQVEQQIRDTLAYGANIPEAAILTFNAPSLPGIGSRGGFTMMLEDRGNRTDVELDQISKQFIAAARKQPAIGSIFSNFRIDTPGYRFVVDREKTKTLGIPVNDIYTALQVFLGGYEVNNFNNYGRTYRVVLQAEPQFRNNLEDIRYYFVRTQSGTMVPLDTLVKEDPINAAAVIQRFNGYRTIQIGGNPAPGYSSDQTLNALEKVAAQVLPHDFSYEWSDQSREEKISGGRAPILFAMAIIFAFLCLAALYESWSIPFAIMLCVPAGIFGAFLFQFLRHLENNVYMQIGLVMLIGLAVKNAILIVEYAKVRVEKGMDLVPATIEAATIRLRPILMTSLAFIIGCIPLTLATGAGAGARIAMGTAVVGGMLMATSIGIFLIPALYVTIEQITKKSKKRKKQTKPNESSSISGSN